MSKQMMQGISKAVGEVGYHNNCGCVVQLIGSEIQGKAQGVAVARDCDGGCVNGAKVKACDPAPCEVTQDQAGHFRCFDLVRQTKLVRVQQRIQVAVQGGDLNGNVSDVGVRCPQCTCGKAGPKR